MSDDRTLLVVPHDELEPETLRRLIEEYVTGEGTDYGHRDISLERKVEDVRRQLERGEAVILFDPCTAAVSINRRDDDRRR